MTYFTKSKLWFIFGLIVRCSIRCYFVFVEYPILSEIAAERQNNAQSQNNRLGRGKEQKRQEEEEKKTNS